LVEYRNKLATINKPTLGKEISLMVSRELSITKATRDRHIQKRQGPTNTKKQKKRSNTKNHILA